MAESCRRFGLPAAEVLCVGDDLARDAVGAHAAGLTGSWLDRAGVTPPPEVVAVVGDLSPVLTLLGWPRRAHPAGAVR